MLFTILKDARKYLPTTVAVLVAALPLMVISGLSDSGEVPRAAVLGVAVILAATMPSADTGRRTRVGAAMFATALSLAVMSAAANGWAAAIFGVHGRFQGLTSTLALGGAALLGAQLFARRMRTLATWVAVSTAVQAAVVGVQLLIGAEPVGLIGNRVPAGGALAVGAAMTLATALFSEGRTRTLMLAVAGVATVALGATGTRGGWIGAAAGVVVVAVALGRREGERNRAALWIAGGLLVAVAIGASANSVSAGKLDLRALSSGSASSRVQIWRGTVAMVAEHPLLGVGPGRFLYEFQAYEPREHALTEGADVRADQAHSLPLHTAAEQGLPAAVLGLGLALLALLSGARSIRAGDSASVIATSGFVTYSVQALLGVPSLGVDALGWLLGAVLLARADMLVAGAAAAPATALLQAGGAHPALRGAASRRQGAWRAVAAAVGLSVALLAGWYAVGDASFARSTARFAEGRFDEAIDAASSAVAVNPLVDVYRVALADAASYAGPAELPDALASIDRGLRLEPSSYDLLHARARLLRLSGAEPDAVAAAYADAVAAYPLGLSVNAEAAKAFDAAGRTAEAHASAEIVAVLGRRAAGETP